MKMDVNDLALLGTDLAELGTDCISRQAAIDAVKRLSLGETDATRLAMRIRIGDYLERLPSAQPEIVYCKDCKWWTKQEDSLQGRCALLGMYPTGGWYCANGRREDGH